jgi:hypothetical protein
MRKIGARMTMRQLVLIKEEWTSTITLMADSMMRIKRLANHAGA